MRRLGRLMAQLLDLPVNQTSEQYVDPAVGLIAAWELEHPRLWQAQDWLPKGAGTAVVAGGAATFATAIIANLLASQVDLLVVAASVQPGAATNVNLSINAQGADGVVLTLNAVLVATRDTRGFTTTATHQGSARVRSGTVAAQNGQTVEIQACPATLNTPFTSGPWLIGPGGLLTMISNDDNAAANFNLSWIEIPRAVNAE